MGWDDALGVSQTKAPLGGVSDDDDERSANERDAPTPTQLTVAASLPRQGFGTEAWDDALGQHQEAIAGLPETKADPPPQQSTAALHAAEADPEPSNAAPSDVPRLNWGDAFGGSEAASAVAMAIRPQLSDELPTSQPSRLQYKPQTDRQRRRARRRGQRLESNKRLDIQGLRAVAVLAVVVNHLTGHPQGGFVGVDVFFVISGYLITSLLLREGNRRGTISLIGFYKRRIRRLFPAALTVTVATLVAAQFIFLASRAREIRIDGIWATLFAANWRQMQVGTDYFKSFGPVSPLQHYWSLSVEEQFYFVWPLLLLIVYTICRRIFAHRRNATITTGTIGALALTVPSLIFAWHETSAAPVVAYFSTFTRAWELGLGATLAVLAPFVRGGRWLLTALSWLGMALIGVSLFTVTDGHVPFPGMVLPCVGSALCLAAWTEHTRPANFVLTNPVSVYIGDISYSIYLVHFPVIIFAQALVPNRSPVFYLSIFMLTIGLSALLYHGIEDPIRESNWLMPAGSERRPRRQYWGYGQLLGATISIAALAMYALLIGAPSTQNPYAAIVLANQVSATGAAPAAGSNTAGIQPPLVGPAATALQDQLKQALLATNWPTLDPPFDQPEGENNKLCPEVLLAADQCTWGSETATHTVYLVGDSTSAAYFNAWLALIKEVPDWRFRLAAGSGCPFTDQKVVESDSNKPWPADCPQRNADVVSEIRSVKPDMVVITGTAGDISVTGPETGEIKLIVGYTKKIVILPSRPHTANPLQCDTQISHPKDCVVKLPDKYLTWLANEQKMATDVGGAFINPTLWYCADGYCPAFVADVPMTKDGNHITATYARYIAPVVLETFRAMKLLPAGSAG
jgi:peptidoglycan/LPS O-acetylase OafA/YrhL